MSTAASPTPLPSPSVASEASEPLIGASADKKIDVLLSLLREDRQEIRFWQERVFLASFWLNGAVLGIVAFVFREHIKPDPRHALAISFLAIFHLLIGIKGVQSIKRNGHDLLLIQKALLLDKPGVYLPNTFIYEDSGKFLKQYYVIILIALNSVLCSISLWQMFK